MGCTNNVEIYGMIHAYNDPIIFDVSIEFLKKKQATKKVDAIIMGCEKKPTK